MLSFPNIKYFEAHLNSGRCGGIDLTAECFSALLRGMGIRYPKVKEVVFNVTCWETGGEREIISIDDILTELPGSLRDLDVSFGKDTELCVSHDLVPDARSPYESLCSIRFSECQVLACGFLDDLAVLFEKYGIQRVAVEVINCTEVVGPDDELSEEEATEMALGNGSLLSFKGYLDQGVIQIK